MNKPSIKYRWNIIKSRTYNKNKYYHYKNNINYPNYKRKKSNYINYNYIPDEPDEEYYFQESIKNIADKTEQEFNKEFNKEYKEQKTNKDYSLEKSLKTKSNSNSNSRKQSISNSNNNSSKEKNREINNELNLLFNKKEINNPPPLLIVEKSEKNFIEKNINKENKK